MYIVLWSFSSSLARATKFKKGETCILWLTLIGLNPVEFKYFPLIVILDKHSGSCNVLTPKIFAPSKTKDKNVKAFNMIANENEDKIVTKHNSCDCKYKFNSATCNSNQKGNKETC